MRTTFNLEAIIRKNIDGLQAYSSARDEFTAAGDQMIFLDANENPNYSGKNRYPDPQQKNLKEELARQSGIASEQLILGNGSDEILDLLFRTFCQPGIDNIINLPPTYGMYKVLAQIHDIATQAVLLDKDFQPKVWEILSKVDPHTKMIFLCSPNNPTGNSFSDQRIEELLSAFAGLVVIDEAYIDFSPNQGWLQRLEEFPNLIVLRTLSKAYGLAGIRLGMGFASKAVISVLNKVKLPYNVNVLTQNAALKHIVQKEKIHKEINEIINQRSILVSALESLSFVNKVYPSEANFLLVKMDQAQKRYEQLLEEGIVVRDRSREPLCENCLRITVGTEEENIRLLSALKNMEQKK